MSVIHPPRADFLARIELIQLVDGWWEWSVDGSVPLRKHPTKRAAWKAAKSWLKKNDRPKS